MVNFTSHNIVKKIMFRARGIDINIKGRVYNETGLPILKRMPKIVSK